MFSKRIRTHTLHDKRKKRKLQNKLRYRAVSTIIKTLAPLTVHVNLFTRVVFEKKCWRGLPPFCFARCFC